MSELQTPRLRFEGFDEAWEPRRLGDVGVTYSGLTGKTKANFGHGDARYVTYMDVFQNSVILDTSHCGAVEIDPKQHEVRAGDALFTVSSETADEVGMAAVWLGIDSNVYLNSFCFGFRPQIDLDSHFFARLLRSSSVRQQFELLAQGISRFNISKNKAMDTIIHLPTLRSQHAIGSLFIHLDSLINQHRSKHQQLLRTKIALMQRMFPQGDANEPTLRIEGSRARWETGTLFEAIHSIVDFRGRTPKKLGMDWAEHGHLALSANNVKHGYIDFARDPHYGDENLYTKWMAGRELHQGQVLFTTEAPMGNVAQVPDSRKYILSQRVIAFEVDPDRITEAFLRVLLGSPGVSAQLTSLSSGGTAQGVSQKSLARVNVAIPADLDEQAYLAAIFTKLDDLISAEQHYIDKLQQVKSGLLQKMFI